MLQSKHSAPEVPLPRVVLLTRDGAYSRQFMQSFMRHAQVEVVGVVFSSAYLRRGIQIPVLDLLDWVKRVGIVYALYQVYILWVLPLRLNLGNSIWLNLNASHYSTNDINSPESIAWFAQQAPDFILAFHFNQKLQQSTIDQARIAALNFHPGFLPRYRGVDPVLFALLAQSQRHDAEASKFGATLHRITPQLDEGDILMTEAISVENCGLIQANTELFARGGVMAATLLPQFNELNAKRVAQTNSTAATANYYSWLDVGQVGLRALWRLL